MAHVSANASSWTLHSNQPLRRFALLLHGSLDRRKKYVATCAASQLAMIVHANDADGGVDVYIHSWDAQRYPGTLPTIHGVNAAYGSALRASLHEPSVADLPRGASQALSIARGAVLAQQLAHAAGHSYETVLAMRHDSLVSAPMRLATFDGAHVWLAQKCCVRDALEGAERGALMRS